MVLQAFESQGIKEKPDESRFFASFDLYVEGGAAFGAIADMLARSFRQADQAFALRTPAVHVRFAVFPFVAAQEKPLVGASAQAQIGEIFRFALFCACRKHSVKHKHGHGKRQNVQNGAQRCVFDKEGQDCEYEINGEQSAGKRVCAISPFEEGGDLLLHVFIPFVVQ